MTRFRSSCLLAAATLLTLGCSSMRSQYLGDLSGVHDVKGLPILVQRPRWLMVTYVTEHYRTIQENTTTDKDGISNVSVKVESFDVPTVRTEVTSVGELFALDLKRPFAGTTEYEVQLPDGKQYPTLIKGKVEDKTLEGLGDTLSKLSESVQKIAKPTSGGPENYKTEKVGETVTLIEVYDVANLTKVVREFKPATPTK